MIDNIGKKELLAINLELEIAFKRSCAYINKKYEGVKTRFEHSFLLADEYVVVYFYLDLVNTGSLRDVSDLNVVMEEFQSKAAAALPSRIKVDDLEFRVYPIISLLPSANEQLMWILSNAYKITIPTSIRHGLDILNESPTSPFKELATFMRTNAVWWFRSENGPEILLPDDDCYIKEYIVSVLDYI